MSNRLQALLILIIIFGWSGLLIYYFFFANSGNLEINVGSLTWVSVELNSEYDLKIPTFICNKICNLSNIPSVKYELFVNKDGYKWFNQQIEIKSGEKLSLNFNLEKLVYLEENKIENKDKINFIKLKNLLGKVDTKDENIQEKNILWMKDFILYYYKNYPKFVIFSFDWENEKQIFSLNKEVISVIFNKNDFLVLIKTKDENYLFDLKSNLNFVVNIKENILYPKRVYSNINKILFHTDNWTYFYDINSNYWIKNAIFNDYIILQNGKILWLINNDDKFKINLLNLEDNKKDKLILHDLESQDKKVVFEIDINISYLELIDDKIFLTDMKGAQFEIKELKF